MKSVMKKLVIDEKGAALILALILLLIGGLISTALLGHMGSGILAGEVHERRTAELYAADAGVEDAIWRIQSNNLTFDEDNHAHLGPLTVNGRSVEVEIYREDLDPTCGEELRYQILSTAVTDDGGGTAAIVSATTVESYVSALYMDFSSLLDNAIVSDTSIIIKNGVYVTGNVTSGGSVDNKSEDVDGTITENAALTWPTADDLLAYYGDDVDGLNPPFPYTDPLDIVGADTTLEALYRDGPWAIYNGVNNATTVTLNGIVYVTGHLDLGTEKQEFTLNLNGQTIFVESASVGDKCTIIGSGCIIALGDVYFAPRGDVGSETDFVLLMSLGGTMTLQPSGTFYGCVAGNVCVGVKSGCDAIITHTAPEGKGLDFPGVEGGDEPPPVTGVSIESWEIEQH